MNQTHQSLLTIQKITAIKKCTYKPNKNELSVSAAYTEYNHIELASCITRLRLGYNHRSIYIRFQYNLNCNDYF